METIFVIPEVAEYLSAALERDGFDLSADRVDIIMRAAFRSDNPYFPVDSGLAGVDDMFLSFSTFTDHIGIVLHFDVDVENSFAMEWAQERCPEFCKACAFYNSEIVKGMVQASREFRSEHGFGILGHVLACLGNGISPVETRASLAVEPSRFLH